MSTKMHFSDRARNLAESATVKVFRRARELRDAGRDIVDLSAGEPDFPSPSIAVATAHKALDAGHTRYTVTAGLPDLRRILAARYRRLWGAPWEPPNVLISVGAKAALYELMQIVVDPGDEVVIPTPTWVSFEAQARLAGGVVRFVATDPADGFAIRAEPIVEAMSGRTRLVILNSPSNPTGGMVSAVDLRQIVEAAAERGALVLCDETYERFIYEGASHASGAALAAEFPETVAVVSSFSKTYAMTGWRIGYALGPSELIAKMAELQGHVTSNPTSFAMHGALAVVEGAEAEVEAMLAAFRARRQLVVAELERLPGVRCRPPAGAFYAFPNVAGCFRGSRQGSLALAEYLLEEAGVAVVPGVAFGADEHVRLSFAASLEELHRGLERLREALRS